VRRHEVAGKVHRHERHELVHAVLDDNGRCRGIVAMDLSSMKLDTFAAAAVCLATGGPGMLFGRSTNSFINTGTAASLAYQQGATYANGEFIQVHPTAISGPDKWRLISESLRGEGARIWVPKKAGDGRDPAQIPAEERWYFLEEKYPGYKNLVPRDVASREIFVAVRDRGLGIGGKDAVYLDIVNPDFDVSQGRGPNEIAQRVEGVVEIYEKFKGADPRKVPMQVFPGVHYSMGGLWVDYDDMTSIPGLFAAGEANFQYHGANRLGANSLISCLYDGLVAGPRMVAYGTGTQLPAAPTTIFDQQKQKMVETYDAIGKMDGPENPYQLWWELGAMMNTYCTVVRKNADLDMVDGKLQEMMERWKKVNVLDTGKNANQAVMFVRQLWNMLCLGRVVAVGARMRDESRGAHYKPEFPERNDDKFMKSTLAKYDAATHGPKISYEDIDGALVKPVKRDYTGKGKPPAAGSTAAAH
jgi:succinate dehydrogenase / fumarate reductase flavoprotein subunit